MFFADPEVPDVAQPDPEGQGDGGNQGAPYQEYLDRIPEEARDEAEAAFKAFDANTTRKFQDAAEFRKQWEPLADTGVNSLSSDEVAWLVQFRQAMEDPQVMQQWWDGYAAQNGLTPKQAEEAQAAAADEYGFQDPNQQQLEQLLEQRLGPLSQQLEQFSTRFDQQDQQAREADAARFIDGQVTGLEEKHGAFDDQTKQLINTLAGAYIESDPMNAIPRAYEDLQRWRNDVEKSALQAKVDAPKPAESGGVPLVTPEQYKRIDDPGVKNAAIEFLQHSNRA